MAQTAVKNGTNKPRSSHVQEPVPITRRSGVTTGSRLYIHLRNRNSPLGRRFADIVTLLVSDLGGADYCSEAKKIIARRAAFETLQLELIEERVAKRYNGEAPPKTLALYQRVSNSLRRLLESIGLERKAKDVTPTLREYWAQPYPGSTQEEADAAE